LGREPFLPDLGKVFRARKGSKLSRFFRLFFEKNNIKKLIGTNFIALVIASSFIPTATKTQAIETNNISTPTVLTTESGIQFPVKRIMITQYYHFFHPGIDLDGVTGDPIFPISAGYVERVEYSAFGYGKAILVSHSSGIKSFYAHLSKVNVTTGQKVDKETKLGEMGSTGRAFGDHLHLEIHENGKPINPLTILPN